MQIKGILFDLDGTVIDSEPLYQKGEIKLFKEYGQKLEQWAPAQRNSKNKKKQTEGVLEKNYPRNQLTVSNSNRVTPIMSNQC